MSPHASPGGLTVGTRISAEVIILIGRLINGGKDSVSNLGYVTHLLPEIP
jgi:hypothetical protein